jgi:uncharacterized membrane protein YphA (DoxX/SURF4 family)
VNIWLWVAAVLLGLAFAGSGLLKLTTSRERMAAADMGWVEDFSDAAVRGIGVLEVAAALGLVLAPFVGLPWLVPVAAIGLMLLMLGAAYVHYRRGETQMIAVNGSLLLVAAFVAYGRLGRWPL